MANHMALILCDGFDKYGQASDANFDGWAGAGSGNNTTLMPGRFGLPGKAYFLGSWGSPLTRNLPGNYSTFYMGVAVNGGFQITFNDVNNNQFWVYAVNSVVQVGRGNYANNLLSQSLSGAVPSSGWYFLEIGATVGAAGSITVNINSNTVLSVSGINIQTSTNASINNIQFGGTMLIDDFYFCDHTTGPGAHPCNTFLGDKRVRTVYPTANISTAFTPTSPVSAGQLAQGNGSNWQTLSANNLILTLPDNPPTDLPGVGNGNMDDPLTGVAPRMARDCTLTSLSLYAQTNYPALKIRPVIASINPVNGMPLAILYAGDEKIGLTTGHIP